MKVGVLAFFFLYVYAVSGQALFKKDTSYKAVEIVKAMMDDTAAYAPPTHAQFPQGADSLMRFINNHLIYPDVAWTGNIQGRVTCQFQVSTDGKISNIHVLKSLSLDTDSEAVRLIKMLPAMLPSKYHGVIINTTTIMRIPFFKPMIYEQVDQLPEYVGGDKELMRHMNDVPRPDYSGGVMGKVIFTLVVGEDGSVIYAKMDKQFNPQYQTALRHFFRGFPRFKPATVAGKSVCTTITIPMEISQRK
jgi:TonB family protein